MITEKKMSSVSSHRKKKELSEPVVVSISKQVLSPESCEAVEVKERVD